MSPRLLQLDGTSLEELKAKVLAEHGTRARVISVETITTGGIGGFFGHRHYEMTVEVQDGQDAPLHYGQVHDAPTPASRPTPPASTARPATTSPAPAPRKPSAAAAPPKPVKTGLDALLDDADGEDTVSYQQPDDGFPVSTSSREFANILDELESVTATPIIRETPRPLPVPTLLSSQGDLVIVVGLGSEALPVAKAMATAVGRAEVATSGALDAPGLARVADRRDALLARARGVERRETLFVAVGISSGGVHASSQATAIAQLRADQVWAVVDASRKPEDTARWVRKLSSVVQLDAVIGTQRDATLTPETVATLGLPVSWEYGS
ncbi:hypothetical protein [Parafrigoribacterium soli]|uniref:hypothetical protein n=1 Tax=Parafrigoribacterium soli TaxID=3144663 RepID=UPI0032EFA300